AKQESLLPEDSMGWLSADRKDADWSAAVPELATAFRRRVAVCRGDRNPRDRFVATDEWEVFEVTSPRAPWQPDCDPDDEIDEQDEIDQVLIAEFAVGRDQPNYVKLYNGTDHPIRLERR
ncbi:MAG: hypothetical protein V3R22_00145, partial [Kiloniellales bacterium]